RRVPPRPARTRPAAPSKEGFMASPHPKTFLLVHRAYHGGWCWQPLVERLRARGHRVYAPTQAGLRERAGLLAGRPTLDTFVADILAVIEAERLDDLVLVGHSFGGATVAGVTDRVPARIRHLVLLDALILPPNTAVADQVPPAVFERFAALAEGSGGLAVPAPPAAYFGVTGPAQAAWLEARLTPHPLSTFTSPLRFDHPCGAGRPITYIACTDPVFAE